MGTHNIKATCDSSQSCGIINVLIELENGHIAVGVNNNIQIWEIKKKDFKLLRIYMGHSHFITCLSQLRQSNYLLSGSEDNTIRVWNLLNLQCLTLLHGHFWTISSILQLKDNRLVTSSWDHTIIVWNAFTFKFNILEDHTQAVTTIIELIDGRLVSGSDDNTIKFWFIKANKCLKIKPVKTINEAHNKMVSCLIQLKDNRLASGSYDHYIKLWNIVNYECTHAYIVNTQYICSMIQMDNGVILTGSSTGSIVVICFENGNILKMINEVVGHKDSVNTLLQYTDKKTNRVRIISGSNDQAVKVWSF